MTHEAALIPNSSDNQSRRMARLAAVQALYQLGLTDVKPAHMVARYRQTPPPVLQEEGGADAMDSELFGSIVTGVSQNLPDIDGMIAGAIDARLSIDRLEPLLRAILRAGIFELHHHQDTASGVIINDYVDVTHAFFADKEPGLVNAILDRIGKTLRSAN